MQTPVEVDFQGMQAEPRARASIETHVAQLEQRYGRITACRVVMKGPSGHHRTSGRYEVHVHLVLPNGREVNIGRVPPADERHADLPFAINDAFKHARRRPQDHVRRLRGQVKQHEAQPTRGRIDPSGEFGFLEADDGHEVYFHRSSQAALSALLRDPLLTLRPLTVVFAAHAGFVVIFRRSANRQPPREIPLATTRSDRRCVPTGNGSAN
jgi:ribosome-associated translation inhibitor RaiA